MTSKKLKPRPVTEASTDIIEQFQKLYTRPYPSITSSITKNSDEYE